MANLIKIFNVYDDETGEKKKGKSGNDLKIAFFTDVKNIDTAEYKEYAILTNDSTDRDGDTMVYYPNDFGQGALLDNFIKTGSPKYRSEFDQALQLLF